MYLGTMDSDSYDLFSGHDEYREFADFCRVPKTNKTDWPGKAFDATTMAHSARCRAVATGRKSFEDVILYLLRSRRFKG
jgi:hypothetical protein